MKILHLQDQYEDWASLGFLRAALASTPASCRLLAKRSWVGLLFRIAEGRDVGSSTIVSNLPTQIMSLRLLASILPQCSREEPTQIQERLFRLLGHSALMCRVVDGSHYGDQGLLQKVRKGRGTRVALTAAHSSTVAEECIRVVRKLHSTAEWSGKVNDYACLKLSLVNEIVAEIPILQMQLDGGRSMDLEETSTGGGRDDFTAQQSSIVASLALIGGFDARPRLGGLVSTPDAGKGVVCRISARGKLLVQLLETNVLKKLPLQLLRRQDDRHFRLEKFVRSEDAIRIATSLFTLISQDFRIDKDKWRMLSDNSDSINLALLRQQQLRLAVVKAVKVFFGHQNILRQILRQTVAVGAASMETMGISEEFGDPVSRDPGHHRREILLIQRLLAKATHPSPVKAIFAAEELESAALAVSQYLASAVAAKKTGSISPGADSATQPGPTTATPADVDNDEARPMEADGLRRHDGSGGGGGYRQGKQPPAPSQAAVTSRDLKRSRRSRPKTRPPSPPPSASATVRQLVEMGFPRHAVEYAVKAWLPDGYKQILRSYVFGPSGFWTMAPLCYAAKFDPFLSLDSAPTPSTLAQSKERKGSNFAIWQPCYGSEICSIPPTAANCIFCLPS